MSLIEKFWDNIAVLKNKILYSTGHHNIYSIIPDMNVVVGEIPTEQNNLHKILLEHGITVIVSLVEDFEYNPNWFHTPIKKEILNKDFKLFHFSSKDRHQPTNNQVVSLLEIISEQIRNNKKVYIHCRSGIGRSALICILYIMVEYDMTFNVATEFVKTHRPEINLSIYQKTFGQEFYNSILINTEYINGMNDIEHV